jgi:hypothetical protein
VASKIVFQIYTHLDPDPKALQARIKSKNLKKLFWTISKLWTGQVFFIALVPAFKKNISRFGSGFRGFVSKNKI